MRKPPLKPAVTALLLASAASVVLVAAAVIDAQTSIASAKGGGGGGGSNGNSASASDDGPGNGHGNANGHGNNGRGGSSVAGLESEDEVQCSKCGKSWQTRTSGLQATASERKEYNSAKRSLTAWGNMEEKYAAYLEAGGLPTDQLNGAGMKLGAIAYSYHQLGSALDAYSAATASLTPEQMDAINDGLDDEAIGDLVDDLNTAIAGSGVVTDAEYTYDDETNKISYSCTSNCSELDVADPQIALDAENYQDLADALGAIENVEAAQDDLDAVLEAQELDPDVHADVVDLGELEGVVEAKEAYDAETASAAESTMASIDSALNDASEAIDGFLESLGEN